MNQALAFIAFVACASASVLHYTDGESFDWPSFTTTLSGVTSALSNTTSVPPYLVVNDVAPNIMDLNFSFPTNSGWVSSQIRNFHSIRLDSGRTFQLNFNSSVQTVSDSYTRVTFYFTRTAADGSTTIKSITVRFQCTLTYCSTNVVSPVVTLSGVVFQLAGTSFLKRYAQTPSSSWTADLNSIGQYFISSGFLLPQDQLTNVVLALQVWGTGTLSFVMNPTFPNYWDYYKNSTIGVAGMYVFHQAVPWALSTLDYSNTTVPAGGATGIDQVTYGFRFLTSSETETLKGHSHVVVGYYLGYWATPKDTYMLPIPLTARISFYVSFSFSLEQLYQPTKMSACITMYLRDDYSSATFPNQTHRIEIRVCQWWSSTLTKPSTLLKSVHLKDTLYDLYESTQIGIQQTGEKKVYIFIASSNLHQVTKLDVFAFVRFLAEMGYVTYSSTYLAGVSAGFYGYYGRAVLDFQTASFAAKLIDSYAQGMNVTVVAPLQCLFLQYSSQIQSCLPNYYLYKIVLFLASTPSVTLLLRLAPFVVLIDELAYYSYHPAPYDRSFKAVIDLAWNITNAKWVPAFLDNLSETYSALIVDPAKIKDDRALSPEILQIKGEDIFFLNMTLDYWVWTVPLACFGFSIFFVIRKLVGGNFPRLLLIPFSSFSSLLVNLICDNLVFMAFRGMMQLRYVVLAGPAAPLPTSNLVISFLSLWTVICVGPVLPMFIYRWSRPYRFEQMKNGFRSCLVFSGIQLIRVGSGILHACQITMLFKLGCLGVLRLITLCLIIKNRKIFPIRVLYIESFSETIKIVLHALLIVEIVYADIQGSSLSYIFNTATICAVCGLFSLLALNLLLNVAFTVYFFIAQQCHSMKQKGNQIGPRIARRKKIIPLKKGFQRAQDWKKKQPAGTADVADKENTATKIVVRHRGIMRSPKPRLLQLRIEDSTI